MTYYVRFNLTKVSVESSSGKIFRKWLSLQGYEILWLNYLFNIATRPPATHGNDDYSWKTTKFAVKMKNVKSVVVLFWKLE